jgi:N-acetylneuraminate synthase
MQTDTARNAGSSGSTPALVLEGRRFDRTHCLIIGEVAQAHDGSLGMAHAFVDAIAATGADAVKFQTHIAAAESTAREPWRTPFSRQDESRFAYWKRMEFTEPQWVSLRQHAAEKGLLFLSSPFSLEAANLLTRIGVPAWKVASGEVGNTALLERLGATRLPLLVSTGMSTIAEIDGLVASIRPFDVPIALLQCTTAYPCPPEKVGLQNIPLFRARYGTAVGLSDHSGTVFPAIAAAAVGVEVVEVHVTLSREMFGADVTSSVTTAELRQLVEGVRFTERMMCEPIEKDRLAAEAAGLREMFTKSIVAAADLAAGRRLAPGDLAFKKPGTGLPPSRLGEVLGRRLRRSVRRDEEILERDLEAGGA